MEMVRWNILHTLKTVIVQYLDWITFDNIAMEWQSTRSFYAQLKSKCFKGAIHANKQFHKAQVFNTLRAKFFRGNINMYLHFMSFLHTDVS